MFKLLSSALKDKDIRSRILYTVMVIVIFRIGAHITVPGVNVAAVQTLADTGLFNILNTFGGGALKQYSIFAMGVSPYITASIVVQLLQMEIVPSFTEWAKQGEVGRRKLNQATMYLTIFVAFMQSIGISIGFNTLAGFGLLRSTTLVAYLSIATVLTAGTLLVTWLGEQITQKGIGNGVSIIIFSGIVAQLPEGMYSFYQQLVSNPNTGNLRRTVFASSILLLALVIVVIVIYFEQAKRKIPVQYSRRATGAKQTAHLPLKINSAGVIPVIFASSFMAVPSTVLGFFSAQYSQEGWFQTLSTVFNYQQPVGAAIYVLLIIVFTYFYSLIQVNPEKVAENLQKQNGYIPSVRPGKSTEDFITQVINRLSTVGSIYLGLVALTPIVAASLFQLPSGVALGGTSLLIVVGVALETAKQIEGKLMKRNYQGFIQ